MKNVIALPNALAAIFGEMDRRAGSTIASAASLSDRGNSSLTRLGGIMDAGHAAFDKVDDMLGKVEQASNLGETVDANPTKQAPSADSSAASATSSQSSGASPTVERTAIGPLKR